MVQSENVTEPRRDLGEPRGGDGLVDVVQLAPLQLHPRERQQSGAEHGPELARIGPAGGGAAVALLLGGGAGAYA